MYGVGDLGDDHRSRHLHDRGAQPGNANYNAATATAVPGPGQSGLAQSFTITKAQQAITFVGCAPSGVTFGDPPVSVNATSATVHAAVGHSRRAVRNSRGAHIADAPVCTIPARRSRSSAGTCTIAANQAETPTTCRAASHASFDIAKAPTTTAVSVVDATYDGNPHGGTASVTGPAGLNQPLTVTYTGTGTTTYGPSATAPTDAGTYSASATYTTTANYLGSSDIKAFTINKAPTTTAVISSASPTHLRATRHVHRDRYRAFAAHRHRPLKG